MTEELSFVHALSTRFPRLVLRCRIQLRTRPIHGSEYRSSIPESGFIRRTKAESSRNLSKLMRDRAATLRSVALAWGSQSRGDLQASSGGWSSSRVSRGKDQPLLFCFRL